VIKIVMLGGKVLPLSPSPSLPPSLPSYLRPCRSKEDRSPPKIHSHFTKDEGVALVRFGEAIHRVLDFFAWGGREGGREGDMRVYAFASTFSHPSPSFTFFRGCHRSLERHLYPSLPSLPSLHPSSSSSSSFSPSISSSWQTRRVSGPKVGGGRAGGRARGRGGEAVTLDKYCSTTGLRRKKGGREGREEGREGV